MSLLGALIMVLLVGAACDQATPPPEPTPAPVAQSQAIAVAPTVPSEARLAFEAARVKPSQDAVAGTYRIAACRQPCAPGDESQAYVVGEVVLFDSGEGTVSPRHHGLPFGLPPNGCYRLRKLQDAKDSYLGIDSQAGLHWDRDSSGTVTFALFRSPDAAYNVEAVVREATLTGVGTSSGAGVVSIDGPDDYVVGRRIGPPDATVCQ